MRRKWPKLILSKDNELWQSWFGKAKTALKSLQPNCSSSKWAHTCWTVSSILSIPQLWLCVMKSHFISQPGDPGQVLGFSLPTKNVQGDAELGFHRISSQSKAQSSSLQETCPWARRQCPFEGITHINGVMRVKSHVIYTLKGKSNAWKNQFG